MAAPAPSPASPPPVAPQAGSSWAGWLSWTWVLVLVLAAVAEACGIEDLRLALDFQRHAAPGR